MMRIAVVAVVLAVVLGNFERSFGIRFKIDKEECFAQRVEYGNTVHFSFVVINSEGWHFSKDGLDLVVTDQYFDFKIITVIACVGPKLMVTGPNGEHLYDVRNKISDKHEFVAYNQGVHKFCFTNKSPYHETIDFDMHAGFFLYNDEHAKDEHLKPLFDHIGKLEEALYDIQFEQHWLEAQTQRQEIVNDKMSNAAIKKALFESAAMIGASVLQVYFLRRLFERKLRTSRV